MAAKDQNRKNDRFLSPAARNARIAGSVTSSSLHPLFAHEHSAGDKPHTLVSGVLSAFPDANPKKLESWITSVERSGKTAPQSLLFLIVICGVQFRVIQTPTQEILDDLWTWVSGSEKEELADLLFEALAPAVAKAHDQRGWQRGLAGKIHMRKRGHPPTSQGAWVAAFLVDCWARNTDRRKHAARLATELATVLLGREVEPSEFYRRRKKLKGHDLDELTRSLLLEYEFWLQQDAVRAKDYFTLEKGRPEQRRWRRKTLGWEWLSRESLRHRNIKYGLWRGRHRDLTRVLEEFGPEVLAQLVLRRVSESLWKPLWGSYWTNQN